MALQIAANEISLNSSATIVRLVLIDGSKITAIRRATYQVNPENGHSCAVLGSVKFEDLFGQGLDENLIVSFSEDGEAALPPRQYFWSENSTPIYIENGIAYNLDGTIYNGSLVGYQPGVASSICTTTSIVYAVYGNMYLPLIKIVVGALVRYTTINNVSWAINAPIVLSLPAPTFAHINQYLTAATIDQLGDNILGELVGWAIAWYAPFATICDPTISDAILESVPLIGQSGTARHTVDAAKEVEIPNLLLTGNATANVLWSFRKSPIVIDEMPAF